MSEEIEVKLDDIVETGLNGIFKCEECNTEISPKDFGDVLYKIVCLEKDYKTEEVTVIVIKCQCGQVYRLVL